MGSVDFYRHPVRLCLADGRALTQAYVFELRCQAEDGRYHVV